MSLAVYTARISYSGGDRLDVTRKSGSSGLVFAPSWSLLNPVLEARKVGGDAFEQAWRAYVVGFTAEMRASYRQWRAAWDALIARESVTLCCYCTDPERCHRTLLARDILPTLGATYGGER